VNYFTHRPWVSADGRIQMSKSGLCAASVAVLIVAYTAGWAVSATQARIATPATLQLEPLKIMTSAKQLSSEQFADYSFVFN